MPQIESVTLHGGPRHGESQSIPSQYGNTLRVKVSMKLGEILGSRDGAYTRVHRVDGAAMHDFEWAGYTTPFVPLAPSPSEH